MNRNDITEKIITVKVSKGLKWEDVAKKVGMSKEWVTAGCLGQMTFDATQAKAVAKIFGLTADEQKWLQVVPYKGSLPTPVPTDPLIYRFYELVSVYGTTFKELIQEEFGDGIMSAIDFPVAAARASRSSPEPKQCGTSSIVAGGALHATSLSRTTAPPPIEYAVIVAYASPSAPYAAKRIAFE